MKKLELNYKLTPKQPKEYLKCGRCGGMFNRADLMHDGIIPGRMKCKPCMVILNEKRGRK